MDALDDEDIGRRAIGTEAHDHVSIQNSEAVTCRDTVYEGKERTLQAADPGCDDVHVGRKLLGLLCDDCDPISTV